MAKRYKVVKLLTFIFSLAGCETVMGSNEKFDWKATESAPHNYPIEIISGTFFYHGDSNSAGLYVPSGALIHEKGWGEMVSSHIVGPDLKPLPDKLHIKYFSYLEDQFYEGNFDLPYDDILSLFRDRPEDKDNPTYNRIMVGVAPGGSVAVWLTGRVKTTEVFFGRADLTEGQLMAFGAPILDREAEVKAVLEAELNADTLQRIREEGIPFDRWSNFRKRYQWQPVFMYGNEPARGAQTKYFNGEGDRLFPPLEPELATQTRAIPMFMQFSYRSPEGWAYLYVIHFDEAEMMEAFSTLGANDEPLQLEFYPHMPYQNTQIRLSNKDDSIVLKKYFIEDI